ncbi:MAG TPA: hypothetical protein GXZ78_05395 [Eubacteriaceae bacterium]|jgi:hypothetical protein|nr:hypothetical protein [Eubacteriaceae bacterium]
MWQIINNKKVYNGGHYDYKRVEKIALACSNFTEDYEEEQIAEEPISCYNCRYRRWTADSFTCMKK